MAALDASKSNPNQLSSALPAHEHAGKPVPHRGVFLLLSLAACGATDHVGAGADASTDSGPRGSDASDAAMPAPDAARPDTMDASQDVTETRGAIRYRLALVQRYGVPVSTATGVSCDGDSVWLVGGGHNALTHTVVHADLASSKVDRTFSFDNLIENLGTSVYGITQRESEVFLAVAGNTNKLVAIDRDTGEIRRSFQAPSVLGPADLDLTDDGQLVESTGTGEVYTLDAQTGAVRASFEVGDENRDNGIAVRGQQAFVGRLFGGMEVFNLSDGKLLGRVTHLDGSELDQTRDIGPMCFRGSHLLILSNLGLSEYELRDP